MDKKELIKRAAGVHGGGPFIMMALLIIISAALVSIFVGAGLEANLLMWAVAAMFSIIAFLVTFFRAKALRQISFITKHGIDVITNGFDVSKMEIEQVTSETIANWGAVIDDFKFDGVFDGCTLEFKEYSIKHPYTHKDVAGYNKGDYMAVGYREVLNNTAYAHELGHIIYREWSGKSDQESQHKFIEENNLR